MKEHLGNFTKKQKIWALGVGVVLACSLVLNVMFATGVISGDMAGTLIFLSGKPKCNNFNCKCHKVEQGVNVCNQCKACYYISGNKSF
jgi:hypothetical protein